MERARSAMRSTGASAWRAMEYPPSPATAPASGTPSARNSSSWLSSIRIEASDLAT